MLSFWRNSKEKKMFLLLSDCLLKVALHSKIILFYFFLSLFFLHRFVNFIRLNSTFHLSIWYFSSIGMSMSAERRKLRYIFPFLLWNFINMTNFLDGRVNCVKCVWAVHSNGVQLLTDGSWSKQLRPHLGNHCNRWDKLNWR